MLFPPIPLQGASDGGLVMLTPVVTELGQLRGVALAGENRPDDREARHSRDVADDVLQLEVHLREGFLHMLDVLAGIGEEHGALAEVTAQHADLVRRPERTSQQAKGMEALNPLTVMHVAFGPAFDFLDLLRVDQEHLEATRLEQLKERDPIDPGGLRSWRRPPPSASVQCKSTSR